MKYIASVSWGKDSTAMLLLILEKKLPLDEIVFYDTGMEFKEIYETRDLFIEKYLKNSKIKYTELKPYKPFLYTMLNYKHITRKGKVKYGYGWCGGNCRWGTTEKTRTINKYCKDAIQYIGIAYDEEQRYNRLTSNKKAPLYEFKIKENDALDICYKNGFTYNGIYKILKRVSCWCCRNKNLKEIENYKIYMPNYYQKLLMLECLIGEPMKPPYFLKDRFKDENI